MSGEPLAPVTANRKRCAAGMEPRCIGLVVWMREERDFSMNDTTTPVRPQPMPAVPEPTISNPAIGQNQGAEQAGGTDGQSGGLKGAGRTIRDEAGKLGRTAVDKARLYADDGKSKASGALGEVARMVDDAANTVDEKLGEQYGQYARSAARFVDDFASTLNNKNVDELLEDTRQFVRKSPAVAVGIAAALGFVVARVVKAGIDGAADAGERSASDNRTDNA